MFYKPLLNNFKKMRFKRAFFEVNNKYLIAIFH